jgi:hypothetical protein
MNLFLKTEAWNDYSIRAHAIKGVLAAVGAERLSQWAYRLEQASKDSTSQNPDASGNRTAGENYSPGICREETGPFCAALSAFRDKLRLTSLFNYSEDMKKKEKKAGDGNYLKEQMVLLREACLQCSTGEAEKIAAALEECTWNTETDNAVAEICRLVLSYDYDKALEKMSSIV